MHNCKLIRKLLTDHALGETATTQARELLEEVETCAACQAEFAALRNTLGVSRQALRSAAPAEEFWPGYRARLRDKLELSKESLAQSSTASPLKLPFRSRLWTLLGKFATTSVRVPIPAALGTVMVVGILAFSVLSNSREQNFVNQSAITANVPTRTIEVPIVQERVVTRVVYLEKQPSRAKASRSLRRADLAAANIRGGSDTLGRTAMSLVGFKPTDQVKLTVIKGSYQDEK